MKRKYANPPIIEAVIEFRFIPSELWDITIPGMVYDKVKSEFPQKREQLSYTAEFRAKEGAVAPEINLQQRIQFIRSDNSALLQIWRNTLAVNHLKPYTTWDKFKSLIHNNLKIYLEIAKPKGFKRLGLRYINEIQFEMAPIELTDYFNYYPKMPQDLIPKKHENFMSHIEIPYEDERDRLTLKIGNAFPEKPNKLALLLDLDYIMIKSEGVSINQISDWIENAHTTVENVFEACITDKCRSKFEEKK